VLIPLKEIEKTMKKVINRGTHAYINLAPKTRIQTPERIFNKRVIRKARKSEMDLTIIGESSF
jgi:hypothetical protein